MVLVDQPAEDLTALHWLESGWLRARAWERAVDIVRTAKTEPAMRSMRVVMLGVGTQDLRQVSSVKDQHVVEDLPPHASDRRST
jgi:hypothetical protein